MEAREHHATSATLETVVGCVRETLALGDEEAIEPQNLLFYDLGFTSMDLLDLLFRLEQSFSIEIPEGTLYALARGEMSEEDFCQRGHLTAAGRERLMALLHDSPGEIFPDSIHAQTLPRYCTVGAIDRLVAHKVQLAGR